MNDTAVFARTALGIALILDIVGVYVLVTTWNDYCDKPLRWYVVGSVFLSSPVTAVCGFLPWSSKSYLVVETVCTVAYGVLVVMGTTLTNTTLFCQNTAPVLWWWCFVNNAIAWSIIMGYLSLTVLLTVLTAVIANKQKPSTLAT
ncbi:putative transmembrane protein [Gregarina niphandrodes]|uniref:Transmembrane protein n=1 Tax=Gregarina niphandrodes TaxID=110365 RepID=A0A023B0X9_GRENI|nr:putative transmembrane protein [Gregarina niphandrodes]EZG45725.1 putative transmembrane protein [Gregarina niphandrodes]|eukprot:XP_011132460.1 putative transmembrane protein [Gregarina niphandrodes]